MWHFIKFSIINVLLIVVSVRHSAFAETDGVTCRDEKGQAVDWFYMYKLPKVYAINALEQDTSGLHYLYITSEQHNAWRLSNVGVDEKNSLPAQTLVPLFADPAVLLIAYNDEFPNGTVLFTGGHTKGVVAAADKSGIWFIHSVPKYPQIGADYEYPATGEHYAQSFLCITLKAEELNKVGEQLIYNEPNFYYSRIPDQLKSRFPNLEKAIQSEWRTKAPYQNVLQLQTMGGNLFKSFAKGRAFQKDLYEDFLAPTLNVNLLVETWRRGPGNLPSNCTASKKVFNIHDIEENQEKISFRTTADHSKWAVSQATGFKLFRWRIGGSDWICVGDINRQVHQLERGGGTVCQKSTQIAELYRNMISDYEPCEKSQQ